MAKRKKKTSGKPKEKKAGRKTGKKVGRKGGKKARKKSAKKGAERGSRAGDASETLPVQREVAQPPGRGLAVSPDLFPPEEIDRLRLVVLTSAKRDEKIEALRRLAYSPLEPGSKAEIFLGRFADPDPEVRVEAAQLMKTLGLDPELAEAVRGLEHGEEPQKLLSIDRLGRRMASGGALEVGAGLIALLWRLREERSPPVRQQILERLEEAHEVIAGAPERACELVRLLVSLFASDPVEVGRPARRLVRRLGSKLPDDVRGTLWSEHDGTSNSRVRVFVLQLLSGLPGFEGDERLPSALSDEIAVADESEIGFRILGDVLMQLGDRGARALIAAFTRARPPQQRYVVWLLADACRFRGISPAVKEDVASLFLGLLTGHQREIQMSVLSTQLPADLDLADETRSRLAEAFLAHVNLFVFPSDVENVEHTISRAGLGAARPLLEKLGPGSPPPERARAARILGELALVEGESTSPEVRTQLMEMLRALRRWSLEPDFPDEAAVLAAMGKVASAPAIPAETVEIVARNLLDRALRRLPGGEGAVREGGPEAGPSPAEPSSAEPSRTDASPADAAPADAAPAEGGFDHMALRALGFLAASPHVSASRVEEIEAIFRRQLEAELPEITAVESEEDGVPVFSIGSEAEVYSDAVPAAVAGLAHIALGRGSGPERAAGVVDFLLARWEEIVCAELDWGPSGSTALIEALRDVASGTRVNVALKVRIVRALARRCGQLPVVEALSQVFASEDRSVDLGRLAAAVGVAILRRRKTRGGDFREDERETMLRALARIVSRRTLDVTSEITRHLREDVAEELFAGLRDGVEGCYEALSRLRSREGLPEAFRESLARRLSAYESLVVA